MFFSKDMENDPARLEFLSSVHIGNIFINQSFYSHSGKVAFFQIKETSRINVGSFEWSGKGMFNFKGVGILIAEGKKIEYGQHQDECIWMTDDAEIGRARLRWKYFPHLAINGIAIERDSRKVGMLYLGKRPSVISRNYYGIVKLGQDQINYLLYPGQHCSSQDSRLFSKEDINVMKKMTTNDRRFVFALAAWSITLNPTYSGA